MTREQLMVALADARAHGEKIVTVAVPSLATTIPAAMLASAAALGRDSPLASAAAKVAMTVSPAPVTSNTSRARAGRGF
jgi:hypothetical protein